MSLIRGLFRITWRKKVLIIAFNAALLAIVFVGYVNDARVLAPNPRSFKPFTSYQKRLGSLFTSQWRHDINATQAEWKSALDAAAKRIKQGMILSSFRFKSPHQVYIALGTYPERLEGRDAVFVPGGKTLRVYPRLASDHGALTGRAAGEVGVVAFFSRAKVIISQKGRELVSIDVPAASEPRDLETTYYQQIGRYLHVTGRPPGGQWTDLNFNFDFKNSEPLDIRCETESSPSSPAPPSASATNGGACFISDVKLFERQETLTDKPRNVVIINVDTLRGDAIKSGSMPHVSAIADKSVMFTNALAAGNMTSPSTNALLACQKPTDMGEIAFAYAIAPEIREGMYKKNMRSYAQLAHERGYETPMIGNISLVSEVMQVGMSYGFEQQISYEQEGYETAHTSREATEWLERNGDKPFFMYVHFNAPHAPYKAPLLYVLATFPGREVFNSMFGLVSWLYRGEVMYTDTYVQKIFDALGSLGILDNTTVLITGDHGDQLKARTFSGNLAGPSYTGAYFDHGATLYQDEIHVPMIWYNPGKGVPKDKGLSVNDFVQGTDVMPTLFDLAGLPVPSQCVGQSLKPYFEQDLTAISQMQSRTIGSEGFRHRAVLFGNRYKYIRPLDTTDKYMIPTTGYKRVETQVNMGEELFDLLNDPNEANNLASKDLGLLATAREKYRSYYKLEQMYELVVDNPQKKPFTIDLHGVTDVKTASRVEITKHDGAMTITGKDHERLILTLVGWAPHNTTNSGAGVPIDQAGAQQIAAHVAVRVDGKPLSILKTSMRLPLTLGGDAIPLEDSGDGALLPVGRQPFAYLRRVEGSDLQVRRIQTGNPQFEQVLRDWGYLNDN